VPIVNQALPIRFLAILLRQPRNFEIIGHCHNGVPPLVKQNDRDENGVKWRLSMQKATAATVKQNENDQDAATPPLAGVARVRPLFAVLGAVVSGIVCAPFCPSVPSLALLAAGLLCLIAALCAPRRLTFACLLVPFFLFGVLRAQSAAIPVGDDVSRLAVGGPSVWVAGTVASPVEKGTRRSQTWTLAATAIDNYQTARTASGRVRVTVYANALSRNAPQFRFGDAVRVRGRVEPPPRATNPGAFDYRAYLARQGVFSVVTARHRGDAVRARNAQDGGAGSVTRAALGLRDLTENEAYRRLPPDDAALLCGLLLSIRGRIPADVEDAFRATGTVHILSTSGFHLALLAGALIFLSRRLPAHRAVRLGGNVACLATIWLYALAAGNGPATVRAALMVSVLLFAPVVRRVHEPLHTLAFAALVLVSASPLVVYDPGAQLSLVAVAGLLLWTPPLEALYFPWEAGMNRRAKIARGICAAIAVSLVAHAATLPLVAYHFNQVSLVAPVANLVIAPLSEAALALGMATVPLSHVSPAWATAPLWFVLDGCLRLLCLAALAFAATPGASVSAASPPLWVLAFYYAVFFAVSVPVRRYALRKTFFAPSARLDANDRLLRFAASPVASAPIALR